MKEILKQSPADWSVTLKVIDRRAKHHKQKNVVYEFNGELQAEGSTENILKALSNAKSSIDKWEYK